MTTAGPTAEDVHAFVRRDWALSRRVKDQAVARHVRRRGAASAFTLAQLLLEQTWPKLRQQPSEVRGLLRYRKTMDRASASPR